MDLNRMHPDLLKQSWVDNAELWTSAVQSGQIKSRVLVTDEAIVGAVLAHNPGRVLDLGCGEGWLTRRLAAQGIDVFGIDASRPLIENARAQGIGRFEVVDYSELQQSTFESDFDVICANFAILDENLKALLGVLRSYLAAGGTIIIQTLHPISVPAPYEDGWREETFQAFVDGSEWKPMPWYFRTLSSWLAVIEDSQLSLNRISEPVNPETKMPASIIFEIISPAVE